MTDPGQKPYEPYRPQSQKHNASGGGCMSIFMLLVGLVLLLPGAAAGVCIVIGGADQTMWREFGGLILVGLMAGFFGIALIYRAFFKR